MGVDFDVLEFCKKLRQEKPPPYQCPLERCQRVYKSLCGLQYHLVNFEHDDAEVAASAPPPPQPPASKRKGRASRPAVTTADIALKTPPKEALTFAEAQKIVQFEIDGKISRVSIEQVLHVVSLEEWTKKNNELEKPLPAIEPVIEPHVKLPEASFKLLTDYNISDAPPRPNAYIRFIEKSTEELDGEVEYDVDEEDTAWLSIINERRQKQNLPPVSIDTLELLMDRLEKESYFLATQSGQSSGTVVDEDAVCCICMDGECQNTNVILFCDMCNLAVHQDCYGVPYIPEGQWLCRRCLQSPSRLVNCVLCPNTGGAFKQTDRAEWAHVVCALWIPEVRFANTVFLEPIDSIETIPPARWKLTCYICKQRGVGACIQCHRANCYAAFHVTCAQHAGLYMKMDAVNGSGRGSSLDTSQSIHVAKMAYCDSHTPPGAQQEKLEADKSDSGEQKTPIGSSSKKQSFLSKLQARSECREKMKQARRLLAKKRSSVPVVLIPTIPPERVQEIASLVQIAGRAPFVQRLIAYWTLKRQYRNGVPLLRRLQSLSHHMGGSSRSIQEGVVDTRELYNQLKYWQRIRQDLERARLLCELVRKRERLKVEHTRVTERWLLHQLKPMEATLRKLLGLLQAKDTSDIFSEPVDATEVPDYSSVVTHPMDLSTMAKKLDQGLYTDLDLLESDFNLMINNCLAYNSKDTVFYKAGIKMMEQGRSILKQARKDMIEAGLIEQNSSDIPQNISRTPVKKHKSPIRSPGRPARLFDKNEEKSETHQKDKHYKDESAQNASNHWQKSPVTPTVPRKRGRPPLHSREPKVAKIARKRRHRRGQSECSISDDGEEEVNHTFNSSTVLSNQNDRTPNKRSPTLASPGEPSPTGVNRRTAVLFTRKAQSAAAFSNIRIPQRPELSALSQTPSPSTTLGSSHTPHLLGNGNGATLDSLAASLSNDAEPVVKKKGRGRPRKHNKDKSNFDKSRLDLDKSFNKPQTSVVSPAIVPASFLEYRGPRDEVGSGVDSDVSHSTGSFSSSCSSCSRFYDEDDDALSSCSESGSLTSGTDRSSCFNETMESTTNQTMSDTENNITRMSGKLSGGSERKLIAPSHWSSDQSECNGSLTSPIKGKRKNKNLIKSPSRLLKESEMGSFGDSCDLAPLQLVWAKCRGYPWYPALIIDPKIPKGFVHNGVPLPVPPQDVLALKKNHPNEPILYLVLFFDAKRTWQWLPPNKLEPLGIKKAIDQAKLVESRKPTDRKAVKKAYHDAMQYNKQVDGEPFSSK